MYVKRILALMLLGALVFGLAPFALAIKQEGSVESPEYGANAAIALKLRLDEENYKNPVLSLDPSSTSVFISKHFCIPKAYKPENLVYVDKQYAKKGVRLREDCLNAFLTMALDMQKEGLSPYIKSGYRVNRKRGSANNIWYAWPGHSEHQTGLAFDLCLKGPKKKSLSAYKYETTNEYDWLCKNAYKYGFILSYPEGKTDITGFAFEPWHWRYVGTYIATDMKQNGLSTFHEYWAKYLSD